jgi:hypothetical protein
MTKQVFPNAEDLNQLTPEDSGKKNAQGKILRF